MKQPFNRSPYTYRRFLEFFGLIGLIFLVSCGGTATTTTGTLSASITDASGCNFDHVYVTVSKIRIHTLASALSTDMGWLELIPPHPVQIDLLQLQNGNLSTLGSVELPTGHYLQVSLVLVPNTTTAPINNYVTLGSSTQYPLYIPPGLQNGIRISHEFEIVAGQKEELVLDFDACQSILSAGNGNSYYLRPNVLAIRKQLAGTIKGFVNVTGSKAVVKAEIKGADGNYYVYSQTRINPTDGSFVLFPLPNSVLTTTLFPNNPSGNFDVVIVADNYSTVVITDVPVTAQLQTVLSTSSSPIQLIPATPGVLNGHIDPTGAKARVRQTINGRTYQIRKHPADLADGSFQFNLSPAAAISYAYTTTLPLISPVFANSTAGNYTVDTPNDDGLYKVMSAGFTVTSSHTTTVNFTGGNSLPLVVGNTGTVSGNINVFNNFSIITETVLVCAIMNGEVINSTGVTITPFIPSLITSFPYSIDDLPPGTMTIAVLKEFVPLGFTTISPSLSSGGLGGYTVTIPITGGTMSPFNFTIS